MKKSHVNGLGTILPGIAIAALLVGVLSFGTNGPKEALAQNATTPTNQTAGNATASTTGGLGNLTNADFSEVRTDLATVREALSNNDTTQAYRALNWAKNGLFELANGQGELKDRINQQFSTMRSSIDSAEQPLLKDDAAKALEGLNNVDVELLKITQKLPPGEEGESEDEAEGD